MAPLSLGVPVLGYSFVIKITPKQRTDRSGYCLVLVVDPRIHPIERQQFVSRSCFRYHAAIQNENRVRTSNRTQVMSDVEYRAAIHQPFQCRYE